MVLMIESCTVKSEVTVIHVCNAVSFLLYAVCQLPDKAILNQFADWISNGSHSKSKSEGVTLFPDKRMKFDFGLD